MKLTLTKPISIVLALVCLLGLFGCLTNLKDVGNAKSYWEDVGAEAEKSFTMLEDGIDQLSANEEAYTEGAEDYAEGLEEYEAGEKSVEEGEITLADGQKEFDAGEAKLIQAHKDYEEGMDQLNKGKAALRAGKEKLAKGEADLAAGKQAYAEGLAAYEAGQAEVAAGEATLAAERQNYLDGKAKLELVTPIYTAAKAAQSRLDDAVRQLESARSRGDLIMAAALEVEVAALQSMLETSLAGYTMAGIIAEYEDGLALIREYEDGEARVAAGKAELAEAEVALAQAEIDIANGEASVAAGRKEIDENTNKIYQAEKKLKEAEQLLAENDKKLEESKEKLESGAEDLKEGKEKLVQGAKDLAAGLEQLNLYEGGQLELAEGLDLAIGTDTYYDQSGAPLLNSIKERLGEDFTYWTTNEEGKTVLINGVPFVDLDKAWVVCNTGREFLADTSARVTKELTGRIVTIILAALTCVVGLVSAIIAFFGKKKLPFILSIAAAAAGIAGLIAAFAKGTGLPFSHIAECGAGLPIFVALGLTALAAAGHAVVVKLAKAGE